MLQVYKNQNMGQAQLNAPEMRNITTGGVAGLMPTDNIVMGKKAMGAIFDAMAERQRIQDNTDLAAASSELQKQVIAFQSQYRQQNMGRDARDAGDVWAQNVGELAGKIGEQFQGRPDLQARFKQAANEMAMRSYATGFTYADQQEAQYRDSTTKEKLAILNDAIGTGTPMDIASAKQDYEATLALLYPGRNLQPELMAADRLVAGGLIERALAEGNIREARALYKEQRDQLGKDAPSYLSKIDAKAEALEKRLEKAQKEAEKKAKKELEQKSLDAVMGMVNEFPVEQREEKLVEIIENNVADDELRDAVFKKGKAQLTFERAKVDATVNKQVREFQEMARSQGWSPQYAGDQIEKAANLLPEAAEKLRKDFNGKLTKETPANRAAKIELLRLIDLGPENNGIDKSDTDAIEAYAYRHGLTPTQTSAALKYATDGGAAGSLTMTMANNAAKLLYPKSASKAKAVVQDYFDLIAGQLEPGKKATTEQVKKILSVLATEGEWAKKHTSGYDASRDTWYLGRGEDMTYGEALKTGQQGTFFTDVPEADSNRIKAIIRDRGFEPTPARVTEFYLREKRGW